MRAKTDRIFMSSSLIYESRASMAASCQDGSYSALVLFVGQEIIELWLAPRCGLMYVQPRSGDKNESQDRSDFHEIFSNNLFDCLIFWEKLS